MENKPQYPGLRLTEPAKDQNLVAIFENVINQKSMKKYLIKFNNIIDKNKWYSEEVNKHHFVVESGIEGKFRFYGDDENDNRYLIDKSDCEIVKTLK